MYFLRLSFAKYILQWPRCEAHSDKLLWHWDWYTFYLLSLSYLPLWYLDNCMCKNELIPGKLKRNTSHVRSRIYNNITQYQKKSSTGASVTWLFDLSFKYIILYFHLWDILLEFRLSFQPFFSWIQQINGSYERLWKFPLHSN